MANIDKLRGYYRDFLEGYDYSETVEDNLYKVYDLTDFVEEEVDEEDHFDFMKYFVEDILDGNQVLFQGNLHNVSVITDPLTEEFLGNKLEFYHGDTFCESFYASVYFQDYPDFFEMSDSIEQNTLLSCQGSLKFIDFGEDEFYLIEISELEVLKDQEKSLI